MTDNTLSSWAKFFESVRKLLSSLIWLVVSITVLATVGTYVLSRKTPTQASSLQATKPLPEPIPWHEVDKAVEDTIRRANTQTKGYAAEKLNAWIHDLMIRVDDDFLQWYFGYWNQQILGLKSFYHEAFHYFYAKHPDAAEKITEEVQAEFTKRVLRPELAQLELENMVRDIMNMYVSALRADLDQTPKRYKIPRPEWERYLDAITVLTTSVEGNREAPLSLKAVYASGAGGAALLAGKIKVLAGRVGSKVAAKSAGKAAATMAAKTGGKVAARAGGKLLGPIIGVGIIIWDVWDHYQTQSVNKPLLRETLARYFEQMQDDLLNDTEAGIVTSIYEMERTMLSSLRDASSHEF